MMISHHAADTTKASGGTVPHETRHPETEPAAEILLPLPERYRRGSVLQRVILHAMGLLGSAENIHLRGIQTEGVNL